MKRSIAELHADHPYDPDERYWRGEVSFEDAAAMAGELHVQSDPVAYLDDLSEHDYAKASTIRDSLLFLPPKVLIHEAGTGIAVWTSVATAITGMNDELNAELSNVGYNIDSLDTASSWEWRHCFSKLGKPILAQYNLMQGMQDNSLLANIDLPELLHENTKPGVELSASRINDYELIPLEADPYNQYYNGGRVKNWSGDVSESLAFGLWLDAPTGFALTYKGTPNAMGGVAMLGTNELMTYQLQGVQGKKVDPTKSPYDKGRYVGVVKSRGLMPLDWQRIMIGATEQIASSLGLENTGIQSAKNNVWTKKHLASDEAPHLPLETAEKIYDGTAVQLNYVKRADDKHDNWHKPITR